MPQNKRQHFVPRFFLKRFSPDGERIALYNIKRKKTVPSAKLYDRCYRNYFYGEDLVVEKALAGAEREIAELLKVVDKVLTPPPRMSPPHVAILVHVLMQHSRTTYATDALNEMNDKMIKAVYAESIRAELGVDPNNFEIGLREPAKFALGTAMSAYPLLFDLGIKLLINRTNEELVTCDNPIVLYNQLMDFQMIGSNCGYASKGLQIIAPLDPRKAFLLYDEEVYRVGSDSKPTVEIDNPQDIYELNTLQMVSANDNIYFYNGALNMAALHKKARPFMRSSKADVQSYETASVSGENQGRLVRMSREDIRTNFHLSFLTLRTSAKRWRNEFRRRKERPAVVVRNQRMVDLWEEFHELCEAGKYTASQFEEFIGTKAGAVA